MQITSSSLQRAFCNHLLWRKRDKRGTKHLCQHVFRVIVHEEMIHNVYKIWRCLIWVIKKEPEGTGVFTVRQLPCVQRDFFPYLGLGTRYWASTYMNKSLLKLFFLFVFAAVLSKPMQHRPSWNIFPFMHSDPRPDFQEICVRSWFAAESRSKKNQQRWRFAIRIMGWYYILFGARRLVH